MDRDYVAYILGALLEQFATCHQQITETNPSLSEPARAALTEFRTMLDDKIEDIATDPAGTAAIDYYGRVAARWLRRNAPGLTPQNINPDRLVLVMEDLISTLEIRHSDEDRWDCARGHIYDDQWIWDEWTLHAVSEMVSYTLPTLIAKQANQTLQTMGMLANDTLLCNDCGYPKTANHICPDRF